VAVIALMISLTRVDGFTGDMRPIIHWRWEPVPDGELAVAGPIEWKPTLHDYPGFLVANRDAYVPDVHLSTDWKSHPPKLLWKHPIGLGYSGFAVVGNAAVTLEQRDQQELVSCYDLQTGKLQWFHAINARHSNPIGGDGPGSTPTLHEGRVYALGGTGVLRCLDGSTGKEIWIRDVLADVGTNYETDHSGVWWGRSASPLIVDDLVVVPGGGPPGGPKVSLVAYNKLDGKIVWRGGNREVSYSSPSLATYCGVRQIVIVNEDTITGHDVKTGEVLWNTMWDGTSNQAASASQTVPVADNRFFVSKGYSIGGGALFELEHSASSNGDDGAWKVHKLWQNHHIMQTKLDSVVIKDGFIYGLSDGTLQCADLKTGHRQWSGADYGHGQLLRVGDVLLVSTEYGDVTLVEFNPNEFHELAKFTALEGKTWNNPALVGNLLLVRNAQEAACYELPLVDGR
jgi:outer membrane protein assembly factor BamB